MLIIFSPTSLLMSSDLNVDVYHYSPTSVLMPIISYPTSVLMSIIPSPTSVSMSIIFPNLSVDVYPFFHRPQCRCQSSFPTSVFMFIISRSNLNDDVLQPQC